MTPPVDKTRCPRATPLHSDRGALRDRIGPPGATAIFSPVPRSIRSMIGCRIVDYARTTARLKEAITWPLKPGPMRD